MLAVGVQAADEPKEPMAPPSGAEVARKYAGMKEWQGFFEAEEMASCSGTAAGAYRQNAAAYEERSHGRFRLRRGTKMTLTLGAVPGWKEIDAVQLVGSLP